MIEPTLFLFPTFRCVWDGSFFRTEYADGKCSATPVIPDDSHHAQKLGVTPELHRVAHEIMHHLIGIEVLGKDTSPVVWRDAHGLAQQDREAELEEWMVTSMTYLAFGVDDREHLDWGAILDVSKKASPISIVHKFTELLSGDAADSTVS